MVPILMSVWLAAGGPVVSVSDGSAPRHVVSGRIFSERFGTVHACSALGQPTIGKWLFHELRAATAAGRTACPECGAPYGADA